MNYRGCVYCFVVFERIANDLTQALFHDTFDFEHPVFHIARRVDLLSELNLLALGRVHCGYSHVTFEFNLVDILETLAQVWLHCLWIFSLRENLEQLIVGQKVKSRKGRALRL
jgi:hypothetical protein